MGSVSQDTIKRLSILYLVGMFADGVYTNFRFQKVLYYAEKDSDLRPFTFQHTNWGQYSRSARDTLDQLASVGYIEKFKLIQGTRPGTCWRLAHRDSLARYAAGIEAFSQELKSRIDSSIEENGYMNGEELDAKAHNDPALAGTDLYDVVVAANLPEVVEINLSDDECEDLELALNTRFIGAIGKIVEGVENSGFDLEKVKKVDTLL